MHDIPLLAESGRADTFDAVIVVDADPELQVDRMARERGWTREDAEARMLAQASREERLAIATHVIRNDGTLEELRARVEEVYRAAAQQHRMSRPTLAGRGLVLLGIAVLAFNLRPAAVSVGPVLDEIRDDLGMSGTEAGILTSLPVIAFAVFGATAPRLAGLLGLHRLTLISLVGVAIGLFGRSQVDGVPAFLALSLLALAGMATANVLLPSLVRLHFPDRVGTITAVYTTALAIGLTAASVLTVPVSEQYDGWRTGLAVWAATAAIAVIPWLLLVRRDRRSEHGEEDEHPSLGLRQVGRTRLGRLMAAFFAFQSLQAYAIFGWFAAVFRDAGFSGTEAGLLLGVVTGVSIPLGFVVPALAGRMTNVAPIVDRALRVLPDRVHRDDPRARTGERWPGRC